LLVGIRGRNYTVQMPVFGFTKLPVKPLYAQLYRINLVLFLVSLRFVISR
jgi:hypothetical protein